MNQPDVTPEAPLASWPEALSPSRRDIERAQVAGLARLLGAVVPANRFYTEKLRLSPPAGSHPDSPPAISSLEEFFARVPFTRKQELVDDQRLHPPYGTNLTFPIERYTRFHQTSGTSGFPLRWLDTPESWSWMVDNWVEVLRVSGVRPGDRILFAFSFGPFLGFWTAFEAGVRLGCLCLPGGGMSSTARLHLLRDHQASVLCCTPTYALRFGESAAESGYEREAAALRTLIVAGEPGAGVPATRSRLQQLWPGARVRDHHGMTETGPVTFECPAKQGRLHVIEPGYIPEVIDPETGLAAGPGEEGELVLTNLGRLGSPLIRYRTGDRVRRSPPGSSAGRCECGRSSLGLDGGILGRTDDMVVVRGVNLYPTGFEEILRRFDEVLEYRVDVITGRSLTEVCVHLEPVPGCAEPRRLAQEVETALRAVFHLRVPVVLAEPGALPRFELKANRWTRRHGAGAEEGNE